MKNLILAFTLLLAVNTASAAIKGAPFQPETDARFDILEDQLDASSQALDGGALSQLYARVTYDVAVDGVNSNTPIGLGVYLPAKAVVTKVLYYIDTQFVDDGTGSNGLQCEDGNNLIAQIDMTSFAVGAPKLGVPAPATPTVTDGIAAQCEITVTQSNCVNCRLPSAGKLTAIVEYFIKN